VPELPEITCRAREMSEAVVGRRIVGAKVRQPKCLNVSVDDFNAGLVGAQIRGVTHHGKWLISETSQAYFLLNLGMGGEVLLVRQDGLPETWRVRLDFEDGDALAINFWWFGYAHTAPHDDLAQHTMSAVLGPNAFDIDLDTFRELLAGRRGRIKSLLLDQKRIAGIGNAYIHDILFRAKLHPLRTVPTLSDDDVCALHEAIRAELTRSIDKGGASYELSLHGKPGGFTAEDLLVGYREGKPCPQCGTPIEKLKTGSTSSFICPHCQPLDT